MKYARAALWIFYGWALRKLHMPKRWTREVEDQASMRMFACSLDFKTVETTAPIGWQCPHFSMTASGMTLCSPPTTSLCDCAMRPVFA